MHDSASTRQHITRSITCGTLTVGSLRIGSKNLSAIGNLCERECSRLVPCAGATLRGEEPPYRSRRQQAARGDQQIPEILGASGGIRARIWQAASRPTLCSAETAPCRLSARAAAHRNRAGTVRRRQSGEMESFGRFPRESGLNQRSQLEAGMLVTASPR